MRGTPTMKGISRFSLQFTTKAVILSGVWPVRWVKRSRRTRDSARTPTKPRSPALLGNSLMKSSQARHVELRLQSNLPAQQDNWVPHPRPVLVFPAWVGLTEARPVFVHGEHSEGPALALVFPSAIPEGKLLLHSQPPRAPTYCAVTQTAADPIPA